MTKNEPRSGRVVLAKREAILKMLAQEKAGEGDAAERERILPPTRRAKNARGLKAAFVFIRQLFSR